MWRLNNQWIGEEIKQELKTTLRQMKMTGGDTNHYTNEELLLLGFLSAFLKEEKISFPPAPHQEI